MGAERCAGCGADGATARGDRAGGLIRCGDILGGAVRWYCRNAAACDARKNAR